MAKRILSLQEQMAELSSVAPGDADIDENDAFDAVRDKGDDSEEDVEDEAKNHARHTYVEMAPSILRKRANHIEGVDAQKYQGVESTRRDMMSDSEGQGSSLSSNEEEGMSEVSEGKGEEEDEEDDDDDDDEDEEEGEEENGMKLGQMVSKANRLSHEKKSRVHFDDSQENMSATRLSAAQSDAKMLQELRKRSREDAEKGRDARTQINLWSKVLGSRIRGQKIVRGAGRIPSRVIKEALPHLQMEDRKAYDSTLASLDELSSHLFMLQQNLLHSFVGAGSSERNLVMDGLSSIQVQLEEASRPKASSAAARVEQHTDTLFKIDQNIFEPLWRGVLARWTSRTSATGLEGGQRNRFENSLKAMNQSAEDQIDRGLTGETYDRLRKRTRVWRGTERERRIRPVHTVMGEEDEGSDNERQKEEEEEADVFDDSDFYQAILRELIDSRGAAASSIAGVDGTDSSFAWAQAAKRAAKKNKNVDLRASKGRKLRYEVLEKVEHFMPPVPRETWNQDQIDRLFRQLKQSSRSEGDVEKDDSNIAEGEKVEMGGLRLFG